MRTDKKIGKIALGMAAFVAMCLATEGTGIEIGYGITKNQKKPTPASKHDSKKEEPKKQVPKTDDRFSLWKASTTMKLRNPETPSEAVIWTLCHNCGDKSDYYKYVDGAVRIGELMRLNPDDYSYGMYALSVISTAMTSDYYRTEVTRLMFNLEAEKE